MPCPIVSFLLKHFVGKIKSAVSNTHGFFSHVYSEVLLRELNVDLYDAVIFQLRLAQV